MPPSAKALISVHAAAINRLDRPGKKFEIPPRGERGEEIRELVEPGFFISPIF
jgi:hypothetical protein